MLRCRLLAIFVVDGIEFLSCTVFFFMSRTRERTIPMYIETISVQKLCWLDMNRILHRSCSSII